MEFLKVFVSELKIIPFLVIYFLYACQQNYRDDSEASFRGDIRFDSLFYSFIVDKSGRAYSIKGRSSFYEDTFVIFNSDTSEFYNVDSVEVLFERIRNLDAKNYARRYYSGIPRAEFYFSGNKIYDGFKWESDFWEIVGLIMEDLPSGYNPFRVEDRPFESIKFSKLSPARARMR